MNAQNAPAPPTASRATSGSQNPQTPSANRTTNAAMTVGLVQLTSRIEGIDKCIRSHQSQIDDLQINGADLKDKEEEHTVEIDYIKSQLAQVQANLGVVLEALGIDLGAPCLLTNSGAGSAPVAANVACSQPTGAEEANHAATTVPGRYDIKSEPGQLTGSQRNEEAQTEIRAAANASLARIYGEPKFSLSEHEDYPDVSKSHPNWPHHMDNGKKVPLHRFDFRESYLSDRNKETFETWVTTTYNRLRDPTFRTSGGSRLSGSDLERKVVMSACSKVYAAHKSRYKTLTKMRQGPAIPIKRKVESQAPDLLLEGPEAAIGQADGAIFPTVPGIQLDITGNLPKDFSFTGYLQSEFINTEGSLPVPGGTSNADSSTHHAPHYQNLASKNTVNTGPPNVQVNVQPFHNLSSHGMRRREANNHPDTIRSRKTVKSQMRLRKQPRLTGDSEKYKGPLYDTYFTPGAMSEDEEIVNEMEDGYVKSTHFEAHAMDCASDELIAICTAIDAIPDSNSSNKTRRERGANKTGAPNVSQTPNTGMRTWMIKKEVLDANPNWIDERRVYTSGTLWKEPEPLNLPGARRAVKRLRVEALPGASLARQANANALLAQQKRNQYMNSQMI
ncbi:hypothetical protein RhiTH_010194 [Rhizoctonia solani]